MYSTPQSRNRTFALPQKVPRAPLQSIPCPQRKPFFLFYHQRFLLPAIELQMNGIVKFMLFCVMLLFGNLFLTFTHVVVSISSSILSIAEWCSIIWIYYLFLHSPIDEHADCFQLGLLWRKLQYIFLYTPFWGYMFPFAWVTPRSRITGM